MSHRIAMLSLAAAAFVASTGLASAQIAEFPRYWDGGYGGYYRYGYGGFYGPTSPLGDGIGVYGYAPAPGVYIYGPGPFGWNGW